MAEQTSRPSRARGLKLIPCCGNPGAPVVAPLAGAWIETRSRARLQGESRRRAPRGRVD